MFYASFHIFFCEDTSTSQLCRSDRSLGDGATWRNKSNGDLYIANHSWLVVSTHLKNISQLGWLFPICGKIKNVPDHQSDSYTGGLWLTKLTKWSYLRYLLPWSICIPVVFRTKNEPCLVHAVYGTSTTVHAVNLSGHWYRWIPQTIAFN